MTTRNLTSKIAAFLAVLFSLPAVATENARQSDSFVDSIGINTHLGYTDTAYGNYSGIVKPMLVNLGVRHIRDGLSTSIPAYESDFNDLAASDVKCSLLLVPSTAVAVAGTIPTALEAVEGPNETDDASFSYNGQGFPTGTKNFQNDLYTAMSTNAPTASLPVLAPSLVYSPSYSSLGAVSCTGGNMHSYQGGALPDANLDNDCGLAPLVSGNANPLYATETGYYTYHDGVQGISSLAQSKYLPRLFLEYFRRGIQRTYSYELLDEWSATNPGLNNATSQSHYGLVSVSGSGSSATASVKPAYTALQNLIALLSDPGSSFVPGSLDYTLSGLNPTALRHILLQKRDGSFWLVVWQDVSDFTPSTYTDLSPTSQTATITFNQAVASATSYLPNTSQTAVATYANPTSLTLTVSDVPQILKIAGVASSTSSAIPASVSMFGAAEGLLISTSPYSASTCFNVDYPDNRCGDNDTVTAFRSVTKFDLPALPLGKAVGSITYSFHLNSIYGAPTTSMDLVSYEPTQGNIRDVDWTDATNAQDLGTVLTPTNAAGTYTIGATPAAALAKAIREAYLDGQNSIALRTQLTGGVFNTGGSGADFYDIGSSKSTTAGYGPSLQLNLVNVFTDELSNGSNILINTPANLSASYGSSGMTLTLTGSGSEWYWGQGGGAAWNDSNNLAFPLAPANNQNWLVVKVESITPGATLQVGAFFFNGTSLVSGKNQILGATNGGMNITSANTYMIDMNAAATAAGVTGATAWKGDFWFSGPAGASAVISTLSTSP